MATARRNPRPSPQKLIDTAVGTYGLDAVVSSAKDLLHGEQPALPVECFGGNNSPSFKEYWLPTWGARALLYVWREECSGAVLAGLEHEHWRPREMCAKVARYRQLNPDAVARLLSDPHLRVRAAAARAVGATGEGEHAEALRDLLDDDEESVRTAAQKALSELGERLERDFFE